MVAWPRRARRDDDAAHSGRRIDRARGVHASRGDRRRQDDAARGGGARRAADDRSAGAPHPVAAVELCAGAAQCAGVRGITDTPGAMVQRVG